MYGNLPVDDRYNGFIPAIWKGQYIIGAFNEQGVEFPNLRVFGVELNPDGWKSTNKQLYYARS